MSDYEKRIATGIISNSNYSFQKTIIKKYFLPFL